LLKKGNKRKKQQELEGLLRSTIIQDALSQQRTGTIIEYNPPKTRTTEAARHAKPPPSTKQLAGPSRQDCGQCSSLYYIQPASGEAATASLSHFFAGVLLHSNLVVLPKMETNSNQEEKWVKNGLKAVRYICIIQTLYFERPRRSTRTSQTAFNLVEHA